MKKIILISLFGLMFGESIETKQIEIYISSLNDYEQFPEGGSSHYYGLDISDYIDLDEGNYTIMLADIISSTPINNSFSYQGCNSNWSIPNSWSNNYNGVISNLPNIPANIKNTHPSLISQACPYIFIEEDSAGDDFISSNPMTLVFWVTGVFGQEDTGYIEEGFDFCLVPGNNLVAFPCDNPVSVETALPELAQAEIEQIIGAGQAATNLNGQFIGSLSNFTPGAGYWFKSSSSMCFNYACAE